MEFILTGVFYLNFASKLKSGASMYSLNQQVLHPKLVYQNIRKKNDKLTSSLT